MKLMKLTIDNFKGIEHFSVRPEGKNLVIRGQNGTGKTTVADAFAWVTFGRSFSGSSVETQIKRRDPKTGQTPEDGGVVHAVEAELMLDDGRPMALRREYTEKWTKKRGAANKEFGGHTTTYSIDGVPMTKKEFDRRVGEIAGEETWRMLSMPLYFPAVMKWQDRRRLLLEVCGGDIPDAAVIESDKALAPLTELLAGRTVEDLHKVLKAKIAKVNEELKSVPARIDEVQQMIGKAGTESKESLSAELDDLQRRKAEAEKQAALLESGDPNVAVQQQIFTAQAKLELAVAERRRARDEVTSGFRRQIEQARSQAAEWQRSISEASTRIESNEARCEELYEAYDKVNSSAEPEVCPLCGQPLPEGPARERFNGEKSRRLTEIVEEGKRIRELQEQDRAVVEKLGHDLQALLASVEKLEARCKEAEAAADNPSPEVEELQREVAALEQKLGAPDEERAKGLQKVREDIQGLADQIQERSDKLSAIAAREKALARVAELKEREQELGRIYSELEGQVFLTEEFVRRKVAMTESEVNGHFKEVRWKMFDQRLNGALEECCEPLIDGVPFGDGLNKGARMRAALDILQVLSGHYHLVLPVIIDDCESYTSESLPPIENQVIRLVAAEGVKELEVEEV